MTNIPLLDRLSEADLDLIKNLYQSGSTQAEIGDAIGFPRRSVMKICKSLGLNRSIKEAAELKNKSVLDTDENIRNIRNLRKTNTLEELAKIYHSSLSAMARLCDKYGIDKPANYNQLQSEKIKKAWTPEKRKLAIETYKIRNEVHQVESERLEIIKDEVFNLYDSGKSISGISQEINSSPEAICKLFRKCLKKQRPLSETYRKLRFKNAKKRKIVTKWGVFNLQSSQELQFLNSISDDIESVEHENTEFAFGSLRYVSDFKIGDDFIEVKPKDWATIPGVERCDFVRQRKIAEHNGVNIKTWYDGDYYTASPDTDLDIYFARDWRLFFDNPDDLYKWLSNYGFQPLKWSKRKLWGALSKKIPEDQCLNANYQCSKMTNLIKHFFEHFWYSNRKNYLPVSRLFEDGNKLLLRETINTLWEERQCNIYKLVNDVNRNYKDFMLPSIFKPWVASTVYKTLLPDGGVVYDPCIGWGGRLIGTVDNNIEYVGSDFNINSVNCCKDMVEFIKNSLDFEPTIFQANAENIKRSDLPDKVDMLFTSPPYDDTEYYHGLVSQCSSTTSIYQNLFSLEIPKVVLNVPSRHADEVKKTADNSGYELLETLEMRTIAPIRRTSMFEPILCFVRK